MVRKVAAFSFPEQTEVLSDEIVFLGMTHNRTKNVFRLPKVLDTKGMSFISSRIVLI